MSNVKATKSATNVGPKKPTPVKSSSRRPSTSTKKVTNLEVQNEEEKGNFKGNDAIALSDAQISDKKESTTSNYVPTEDETKATNTTTVLSEYHEPESESKIETNGELGKDIKNSEVAQIYKLLRQRESVTTDPNSVGNCFECLKDVSKIGYWLKGPPKSVNEREYLICANCAVQPEHKKKLHGLTDKLDLKPEICDKHQYAHSNKLLTLLYCETCSTRLCPDCLTAHQEHAINTIEKVAENARYKIRKIMLQNDKDKANLNALSEMAHETTQILDGPDLVRTKWEIKNILRACLEKALTEFDSVINGKESSVAESHLNIRREVTVIDNELKNVEDKQRELQELQNLPINELIESVETKSKDGSLYRPNVKLNVPYLNKESLGTNDIITERASGFLTPKFKEFIDIWLKREMLAPKFEAAIFRDSNRIGMQVSVFRQFPREDKPRMKASKSIMCLEKNTENFDKVELELISSDGYKSKVVSVECQDGAMYGLSSFADGVVAVVEPDRCSTLSGASNNLWSGTAYLFDSVFKDPQVLSVQNCHGFVKKGNKITALCAGKKKLKFAPKLYPPIKSHSNFELPNSTWVALLDRPYACAQLIVAIFQEHSKKREQQKLEFFILKFNSDAYMRTEIPMRFCKDIDDMAFIERNGILELIFCKSVDQTVMKIELKKPTEKGQILSFGEPKLLVNPQLRISEPVLHMMFFDNCAFFQTDGGTLLKVKGFFDTLVDAEL